MTSDTWPNLNSKRKHAAASALKEAHAWAVETNAIALAFCGSYARGEPRQDSDLDICIFVSEPETYLTDTAWVSRFGNPISIEREDWGPVQSLRVLYEGGLEIEFGLTAPQWANVSPVDPGTRKVVLDGFRIVYDPTGRLQRLVDRVIAEE